jgi:cyclophilin family peptidyl-prolyl cis-trans isomerase|tara:strand:- start:216 stop:830 length:615 start_codon:yes stop_codon:yes gene_type:complete
MAKAFAGGLYNEKSAPRITKNFDVLPEFDPENAQTFFDLEIGTPGAEGNPKGRVVMEMFSKQVPKTADNFLKICNGDNDSNLSYKGNFFHRIIDNFMAQGGDITAQNGTGGKSIYGHKFPDEQVWYPHTHKGVMSMANSGPDTNGSQFFINYAATPHLNGKHTVFGRVIDNYDFMHTIMLNPTGAQDKPLQQVTIVDCGELTGD